MMIIKTLDNLYINKKINAYTEIKKNYDINKKIKLKKKLTKSGLFQVFIINILV